MELIKLECVVAKSRTTIGNIYADKTHPTIPPAWDNNYDSDSITTNYSLLQLLESLSQRGRERLSGIA